MSWDPIPISGRWGQWGYKMYVRKFEAETMEDALKNIKQELGPDAIILKTTTNKGLKGAFKKNK